MATTKVKAPDGSIITVKHREGASKEEIIAFAQNNWKPKFGALDEAARLGAAATQGLTLGFADEAGALAGTPHPIDRQQTAIPRHHSGARNP